MLVQIFNEVSSLIEIVFEKSFFFVMIQIKQREPNFHPARLFDFGSGTGSVMW